MRRFSIRSFSTFFLSASLAASVGVLGNSFVFSSSRSSAIAQTAQPLTIRGNSTEANARTGVVVVKGNVQINYPSRQIQATSAQAVYFSNERRIVLSGDVYVLQQGNSLRGEQITYLVDEGRFLALPQTNRQVEAIYMITEAPTSPTVPATPNTPAIPRPAPTPFSAQPEFPSPAPNR
ncbi:ostA-like family protein [Myxacorys almedinensis A]|uniref:OstA-like family protein n=2 Tax=Myxacorys TaxID=2056239 RepID=A0A8J8CHW5_9CYAN|nr:ostA-like family protein [Myxacorys almedinensis A]